MAKTVIELLQGINETIRDKTEDGSITPLEDSAIRKDDVNELLYRGILTVSDVSELQQQSGNNSLKVYLRGAGIFTYSVTEPTGIYYSAYGEGYWLLDTLDYVYMTTQDGTKATLTLTKDEDGELQLTITPV